MWKETSWGHGKNIGRIDVNSDTLWREFNTCKISVRLPNSALKFNNFMTFVSEYMWNHSVYLEVTQFLY